VPQGLKDKEAGALGLQAQQEILSGGTSCVAPASSPSHKDAELQLLVDISDELARLTNHALLGRRPETYELVDVSRALRVLINGRIDNSPLWGGGK